MQYLLLIYQNEAENAARSDADKTTLSGEYGIFTQGIIQSGHFKGGERLHPSAMATTVRVRGGKTLATDGPYAEAREQTAGYYLIEARDHNDACAIAARIPGARNGAIEVRPIWPHA